MASTASNWASDVGGTATPLVPGAGDHRPLLGHRRHRPRRDDLGSNMSVGGIGGDDTTAVTLNADIYTLTLGSGGLTVNSGAGAVTLNGARHPRRRPGLGQ